MTEREEAAELVWLLSEAASPGYFCLADDLGDLHSDLTSGKASPTLSRIVEVVANYRRAVHTPSDTPD